MFSNPGMMAGMQQMLSDSRHTEISNVPQQMARAYTPPAARHLRTHVPRRGFRAAQP
jgi:hypothetical protein